MVISFENALQESTDNDRIVLLGNGFSIGGADVFSYQNILQKSILSEEKRKLFSALSTFDFEVIIDKLDSAANLLEVYKPEQAGLIQQLKTDSQELREKFAEAITSNHTLYSEALKARTMKLSEISSRGPTRRNCIRFLSNFKQIFTTNYDLLLYWIINYYLSRKLTDTNIPHFDGFSRTFDSELHWVGDRDWQQNVFFLHGSLLFYQVDDVLYKIEQEDNELTHFDLLSIVRKKILEETQLPLIVFEGSSNRKIEKISEHYYLTNALNRLKHLEGSLFIFGHSLDTSDDHIFNKINESKVSKIYISLYNLNEEARLNKRAHQIFLGTNHDRKIQFFDSQSANVWVD